MSPTSHLAGGWQPIENITDSHVKDISNYATSEHNKQSGDNLEFVRVVSGETQSCCWYKLPVGYRGNGCGRQCSPVSGRGMGEGMGRI